MQSISFTCMHCERRLKAPQRLAGQVAKCPKCLEMTAVPGPEGAGLAYAVAGESTLSMGPAAPKQRESAAVWRAFGYERLSAKSKGRLAEAEALAGRDEWERAASLLNALFRSTGGDEMTRENAVFRTPLSYCLTRWAVSALDGLKDDPAAVLSKPMRRLLVVAAEKQKWGGVFDIRECGLCRGPLKSIGGRASVRTTVGTAYLCCAKPTQDDASLVSDANAIWQRLTLAAVLDDQNEDARYAVRELPAWQVPLRVEKLSVVRGNSWVRWDEETDGLLSELIEKVIEKSIEGAIGGISEAFD